MDDNAVLNPHPKRQRNSVGVVDRISALPDFILGDILSSLPTKQAVATSILSKRWKSAWVMVRNLDFFHNSLSALLNDMQLDEMTVKFIDFVYRVLFLHDFPLLNKFTLTWYFRHPVLITFATSWINTAIARNVRHLTLHIRCVEMFRLPLSVFTCVSLQCLQLDGNCLISLPTSYVVCLPRLNKLILTGVDFPSEEAFEKLIIGCPMLYHLDLPLYGHPNFTYRISSSSLRCLFLHCMDDYNLKLEAPSLEYLKFDGNYVPIHFVVTSLSSHLEVEFAMSLPDDESESEFDQDDAYNSIVEAVGVFHRANALILSADTMVALSHGTLKLSAKFNNLVRLKVDIRYRDWGSLQDLIQRSDNLQVLTIHQDLNSKNIDRPTPLKWTTPAQVPNCLSKSLKKIVFDGYDGNVEDEHEMMRYMLTHGSVLEVMHIVCGGEMNSSKLKSVQEIGQYPRNSPICAVKFFESTSSNNVKVCFTNTARPST